MKNFIAVITFILFATSLSAQQDIISKVSTIYFNTNGITDMTALNRLNDSLVYGFFGKQYTELMDISIEEISSNMSYHKVSYTKEIPPPEFTPSTGAIPTSNRNLSTTRTRTGNSRWFETNYGLLKISWMSLSTRKTIENVTQNWINDVYNVYNKEDLTVGYVNNDKVNGSYIIDKRGNSIGFIILSTNKLEMLRGDIILNVPESERIIYAKEFIESFTFEPTPIPPPSSSGGGSTRTSGGRTRGGG